MSNLFDYIKWRGDLSMHIDPFNDIDGLILSELIYTEFDNVVPEFPTKSACSLKDAAKTYYTINDVDQQLDKISFTKESIMLLKVLGQAPRYQNILLSNYINELDYQANKQFAAITYQLEDGTIFVAYRGTDDTILGWKEDFMMTYKAPVASQTRAAEYLEEIAKIDFCQSISKVIKQREPEIKRFQALGNYISQKTKGVNIRIGGHSKGGNLAVYAASNVSSKITGRIIEIYNNDGPGFNHDMIKSKNYQNISTRIKKFIPEGSVFGIMLENIEEKIVIKSCAKGIMQHSGFTWQIEGTSFIKADSVNKDSEVMDAAFRSWLANVDIEKREHTVKAVFSIFDVVEVKRLNDFTDKTSSLLIAALKELKNMDSDTRDVVIEFFKGLISEYTSHRKESKK